MRHADRPTVEVEQYVDAPPERIWPLVTDIALPAGGSSELQSARWLDCAGPAVGHRFVGTNANRYFGEWETTSTVVEYDEPRAFGWAVGDVDEPNTSWRFTLRSQGAGTVVTQWMQLGTGASGLHLAIRANPDKEERIVARRLDEFRAAMRANLDAIRARAERPAP